MVQFTRQPESFTWGVFTFHGPESNANGPFDVKLHSKGTHLGDAEEIFEEVRAALGAGKVVSGAGWEARQFPLVFTLGAADGEALAVAERELERQSSVLVPPPLIYTPPLGLSAPVALDVQVARKRRVYDGDVAWDYREAHRGERTFELTFICRPHVRSVEKIVIPALAPPLAEPSIIPVTDCDTVAGWSVAGEGPVLSTGSTASPEEDPDTYVQVHSLDPTFSTGDKLSLAWAGDVAVGDTKWLAVRSRVMSPRPMTQRIRINGQVVAPDAQSYSAWTSWYPLPADAVDLTSFELEAENNTFGWPIAGSDVEVRVFRLWLTDSLPLNGTGRQLSRLSEVRGGRETEATIRLWDETPGTLGRGVLIHTSRNLDWVPMLRPWEVDGGDITAEAAFVSGGSSEIRDTEPPFTARIPAEMFTEGMYSLMARVNPIFAQTTVTWTATVVDAAGVESPWAAPQTGTTVIEHISVEGSTWRIVELSDDLHLPPSLTAGAGWFVQITLEVGAEDVLLFDEGWLFGLDDGCLTWWEDPTESAEWLEVRSPDVGGLYPSIWAGTDVADMSKGMEVSHLSKSGQPHRFRPGPIRITTVCLGSTSSRCELEYYLHGDHHIVGADLQPPEAES